MKRIASPRIISFFTPVTIGIATLCLALLVVLFIAGKVMAASAPVQSDKHLLTIHDRGSELGVVTSAATVREALQQNGITTSDKDIVEPGLDDKLVAESYQVNIYRARPVLVVDGATSQKVLTAAQTDTQLAKDAGVTLHDEDNATIEPVKDIVANGPGLQMTIDRATPFTLVLYGTKTQAYTQETTVGDMLRSKGIGLQGKDVLTVPEATPITADMTVAIWRDGEQTVAEEQAIDFDIERVFDGDQPVGYHAVKTKGVKGVATVAYKVVVKDGKELSRTKIRSVVTTKPTKQVEVIGTKTGANALSKSRGAQVFVDSKGISHRETYYDLNMNSVMGLCGGGTYTVRTDGAKVDKDGYILIAANLGNYPRCSVVETSMGPGKVYDTGGFAARHPHGFDLATDWSNNDGR